MVVGIVAVCNTVEFARTVVLDMGREVWRSAVDTSRIGKEH